MPEESTVRVNFGRPMPIFPLNAVVLLPHAVIPLHIFEPRYRQLVNDALDGTGQLAMAVFEGDRWKSEYHGRPPVRPAVCVAQIVQHHRFPDGRYNVALQGICRAHIVREVPASQTRLYREALLEPVGVQRFDEAVLRPQREALARLLSQPPLTDLRDAITVREHLVDPQFPTSVLLDLVSLSFVTDPGAQYRLLDQGDPRTRAAVLLDELGDVKRLLERAQPQREGLEGAPKGVSWN
ncbi:MAG TPA: LON peptidase substrate-binding domain-containing protein [Phycisphaerales bacterium]|nr:LON peptidase substrate-binding domain-containing protein [Phycisphaerales bacterium]